MKKILQLFLLLLPVWLQSQTLRQYTFEEVDSLMLSQKRPVLVFIHTYWCPYCRNMENTTFQDSQLTSILHSGYYFVALDAQTEKPISFKGHTFLFKPTGNGTGVHELAEALALMQGRVSYPTLCILNSEFEIIFQYAGFLNARQLEEVLEKLTR